MSETLYERGVRTRCAPAEGGPLAGKIIRAPRELLIYMVPGKYTHVYSWIPLTRCWVYCDRVAR